MSRFYPSPMNYTYHSPINYTYHSPTFFLPLTIRSPSILVSEDNTDNDSDNNSNDEYVAPELVADSNGDSDNDYIAPNLETLDDDSDNDVPELVLAYIPDYADFDSDAMSDLETDEEYNSDDSEAYNTYNYT